MNTYTEEEVVEALRQEMLQLPRYSFRLSAAGGVVRERDPYGRWIERDAVHQILDSSVSVDWIVAKLRAARALKQVALKP